MNDVGILIVSCDKNIWLLKLFFENFYRFWPNCPFEIYVSLERQNYSNPHLNLTVFREYQHDGWGGRVKKCLEKINEKNILLMLDDFIIEEKVDSELLTKYINYMRDSQLSNIILTTVPNEKNYKYSPFAELLRRDRFGRYKTSLQCGLWNKYVLDNLLRNNENPWEFEIFGNIRSFTCNGEYFALKDMSYKPIVYNDGFFVVQGKVNLPEKRRLEEKIGRDLDIGGSAFFEKDMVRDNIAFIPRVLRRIRIIIYYSIYRIRYSFIRNK